MLKEAHYSSIYYVTQVPKITLQRRTIRVIIEGLSLQDAFAKSRHRSENSQVTVSPVYGYGRFVTPHSPENIVKLHKFNRLYT